METKQVLTPKFCPACGSTLSTDRQGKAYCVNRQCVNFGVAINLAVSEREVALETTDTPFTLTDRQFTALLDQMSKSQTGAYWTELQETSRRQLSYLSEAATALGNIERDLRNLELAPADREQALNRLNMLASLIENRASLACLMNSKATAVILALQNLEMADDKLKSDQIRYQLLKDKETEDESIKR